jgi:hypothetical protein
MTVAMTVAVLAGRRFALTGRLFVQFAGWTVARRRAFSLASDCQDMASDCHQKFAEGNRVDGGRASRMAESDRQLQRRPGP